MSGIQGIQILASWPKEEGSYKKIGVVVKKSVFGKQLTDDKKQIIVLANTAKCFEKFKFWIKEVFGLINTNTEFKAAFKAKKITQQTQPQKPLPSPRGLNDKRTPPEPPSRPISTELSSESEGPNADEEQLASPSIGSGSELSDSDVQPQPAPPTKPKRQYREPVRQSFPFSLSTLKAGEVNSPVPFDIGGDKGVDDLLTKVNPKDSKEHISGNREEFLNEYLSNWPYLTLERVGRFTTNRERDYVANGDDLDRLIRNRIQFLNEKVNFEARLEKIKDSRHLDYIQMRDLLVPWKESALSIALLNDEEFAALPLARLDHFSPEQMSMVRARIAALQDFSINPDKAETLADLYQEQYINERILSTLSPKALGLLTPVQIGNIVKFPKGLLKDIFNPNEPGTQEKIQKLDDYVLSEFVGEFTEAQWKLVSQKQISSGYFWRDKTVFDILFPKLDNFAIAHAREYSKNLAVLDKDQINYSVFNLFDGRRFQLLQDAQFKELNLFNFIPDEKDPEITKERKQKFLEMLPVNTEEEKNDTKRRMKLLKSEGLQYCVEYMTPSHICYLTQEHIESWNMVSYPFNKEQLESLFPTKWSGMDLFRLYKDLAPKWFSVEQIRKCIELLNGKQMMLLSDAAIQILGFYSLSEKQILDMFSLKVERMERSEEQPLFDEAKRKMALLNPDQLSRCYKLTYENGDSLIKLISDDQLKNWDFQKLPISQKQFDELFPSFANSTLELKHKQHLSRIKLLSADQIKALNWFFDRERKSYIVPK